ncbi:MAG TPA: CARDB domain-containing protein, partial [Cytophagaceae bacterium]
MNLYIWPDSVSARPSSPKASNIKGTVYSVTNGLDHDVLYKWQVVGKNNCHFAEGPVQKFKTMPLPDLYIASSSIPTTLTGGTTVTLTWEVKNKGLNSTGNSAWKDRVYLSNDPDLRTTDDQLLATFDNVSYLQPGKSYIQTRDVAIPSLPGTYYLFIITDNSQANCMGELNGDVCSVPRNIGFHNVAESDEHNNYIYKVVNIAAAPAADLEVISVGVPTTVFNGSTINVNYFVKNVGQANAVGKKTYASGSLPLVTISTGGGSFGGGVPSCYDNYWYDMIYLSTDDQFSPETDINIGYSFVALKSKTQKDACGNFAGIPLPVDSTYNMIAEVNLPPKYVGNYYILVVAADQEGVDEAKRYSNNVKASEQITINLTPPPDLAVTELIIPTTAVSGQEANFSYTVKNIGASAPHKTENVWYDHIFISKKNTFVEDSCISIGKYYQSIIPAFLPDSFYTNLKTIKIPEGLVGDYYVYVVTDKEDKIFEHTFTENNIRRSTGTINITAGSYPDLELLSLTIPDTIYAGKEFTVTYQVKNNGTGRAALTHYDQLYYSGENVWKPALGIKASSVSQVLEPGQTVTRQIKAHAPEYIGEVWFFLFTDCNNAIFENGIEDNNLKGITQPVYIKYAPLEADLEIPASNFPVVAQSGSIINVSATVRNLGNEATKAGTWADGFYLSSDTLLDADDQVLLLRYFRSSVLNPTATYDINANLELPQGMSGKYYIIFVVDANKLISNETNRLNNYVIKAINISASPAPDLIVTSLIAPAEAFAGQKIKVKYTVKNQGGSDAKSK